MTEVEHRAIIVSHARRAALSLSLTVKAVAATLEQVTEAGATLHQMGCDLCVLRERFPDDDELESVLEFVAATQIEAFERAKMMARTELLMSGASVH